jgi:hypothetical protein
MLSMNEIRLLSRVLGKIENVTNSKSVKDVLREVYGTEVFELARSLNEVSKHSMCD